MSISSRNGSTKREQVKKEGCKVRSPREPEGVGASDMSTLDTRSLTVPVMSALLLRHHRTLCFFCQSPISPPPPQPHNFLCPHCGCWNRYDANGDILSDDPAMHDESLNRKSFARRGVHPPSSFLSLLLVTTRSASPRKDRLLTTFGSAPFCSTCQSNQRLIVSLLSSYLPPSDDVRILASTMPFEATCPLTIACRTIGSRLRISPRQLRELQSFHARTLSSCMREMRTACRRGDTQKGYNGALKRARVMAE